MSSVAERPGWMSVLAKASETVLAEAWDALPDKPGFDWLRAPETGTVMVRGRIGGSGGPFNLGEMTVTRAALRLATGEEGHAYVAGRSHGHARIAALCDALMHTGRAGEVRRTVLQPAADALDRAARDRAEKAAATKVDFLTLVRGED